MNIKRYTLNNTVFGLCAETGALMTLEYPGVKPMFVNKAVEKNERPTNGALFDLAWPVHFQYETLRANPTEQINKISPVVEYDGKNLTLTYERLPQSFYAEEIEETLGQGIYARLELKALEDGKSVAMQLTLKNNSQADVEQILFPNFEGLSRTDEDDVQGGTTEFTFQAGRINPYTSTVPRNFVSLHGTQSIKGMGIILKSAGLQTGPYVGRWFDWGSYKGGFCMFRKRWGWDKEFDYSMGLEDLLWIKYYETENSVRAAGMHNISVKAGEEWVSDEYIITAHANSWLYGIDPYKEWVKQNVKRAIPMNKKAREMLGTYSVLVSHYPMDPREIESTYDDMPRIAKDLAEHGIFHFTPFKAFEFTLPMDENCFYKNMGGLENWNKNVAKCNEYGVDIMGFVSWLALWGETCKNYGIENYSTSWAVSEYLTPSVNAPYARKWACHQIDDHSDERWTNDVRNALKFLRDKAGVYSLNWDQYILGKNKNDAVHDILVEYRQETAKTYPDAILQVESTLFFDSEVDVEDYPMGPGTGFGGRWDYDLRPMCYVHEQVRGGGSYDSNEYDDKWAFMDNYILGGGGSKKKLLLSDNPVVSARVKHFYQLRKKYMDHIAYGLMLGDGLQKAVIPNGRVNAYLKDGSILMFALKRDDEDMKLSINFDHFLGDGEHGIVIEDEQGNTVQQLTARGDVEIIIKGAKDSLYMIKVC